MEPFRKEELHILILGKETDSRESTPFLQDQGSCALTPTLLASTMDLRSKLTPMLKIPPPPHSCMAGSHSGLQF
jgi:hypothetical protein